MKSGASRLHNRAEIEQISGFVYIVSRPVLVITALAGMVLSAVVGAAERASNVVPLHLP